jgi:DNA-binding NtrC family response regulator
MLDNEGCQVVTASGIVHIIKLIREKDFDLILTDFRLGSSS